MATYTKIQRTAFAILIVTDGVKSEDLEKLGVTKTNADAWAKQLLERTLTFQDALDIYQKGDSEVSINHLLALCLDQRFYTKKPKRNEEIKKLEDKLE